MKISHAIILIVLIAAFMLKPNMINYSKNINVLYYNSKDVQYALQCLKVIADAGRTKKATCAI